MMQTKLAKSAVSVQEALDKLKLECKVLELPSSTRTAIDAASSIGCDIGQIVKSLVFRTKKTGKPVLVLASGPNQVDIKTIEDCVGESITKADADFVREVTGFAIGGIPPVGHKNAIDFIYIDQDLMELDEVWAAAGTPNAVFCIKSQDLLKATDGKLINIKEEK
ncbi:MAG: YbaK/EbsC family protein [Rickettsiaceae bacterium]|nr:YbaK/EbsC family protein [Rickettsiaceae bacterium]